MFTHDDYCDLTGEEIARFAKLIRGADPGLRVPACRRWRLEDLIHHTGAIHRWATGLVAGRARRGRAIAETDDWDPDASAAGRAGWIAFGGKRLLDTLRTTDPDTAMWAWGADKHARFWSRRMTHETGVHRADAELALGREPRFTTAMAVDGVSEFLENLWYARAWRWSLGKLRGNGEKIRLVSTDTGDEWAITLGDSAPVWSRRAPNEGPGEGPDANVTVRADATSLYLMSWGRYKWNDARCDVSGDTGLLRHWQRNSAV
ncbi:MAG: maleylpyruvate isomerase family mycothiol-dependent enzyme [Micromonosporaceae bacterium]